MKHDVNLYFTCTAYFRLRDFKAKKGSLKKYNPNQAIRNSFLVDFKQSLFTILPIQFGESTLHGCTERAFLSTLKGMLLIMSKICRLTEN
jgi:hypothetical protein